MFANTTAADIRAWAKVAGLKVEDRGRMDHAVVLAYAVAHLATGTVAPATTAPATTAPATTAPATTAPATTATDTPVAIDARSFVKVSGEWFVRVMPNDIEGDTVEVARRNRPATMATLGAISTRKIGAQTYRVAPMVTVKAEKPAKATATPVATVDATPATPMAEKATEAATITVETMGTGIVFVVTVAGYRIVCDTFAAAQAALAKMG